MAKYLFAYRGGKPPASAGEVSETMAAWGAWFGALGAAVIDGGNPVHGNVLVKADGSLTHDLPGAPLTGYSLIEAADIEDAHAKARSCPLLKVGGTVEIAEAIDM